MRAQRGISDTSWLQTIDEHVTRWMIRHWNRSVTLDAFSVVVGRWTPVLMVAAIAWAAANGVDEAFTAGLVAVTGAVVVRGLNTPVSRWIARPRPFEAMVFVPLLPHERGESFPSNHAAGAVALAAGFWPVPGYRWLLLAMALCLCVSRVYHGVHYLSDVVAGAIHGAAVTGAVRFITSLAACVARGHPPLH